MSQPNDGVVIGFKEIYDEVRKTGTAIELMNKRLTSVEIKQEKQEQASREFRQKVLLTVIGSIIPLAIGVMIWLVKGGALG